MRMAYVRNTGELVNLDEFTLIKKKIGFFESDSLYYKKGYGFLRYNYDLGDEVCFKIDDYDAALWCARNKVRVSGLFDHCFKDGVFAPPDDD